MNNICIFPFVPKYLNLVMFEGNLLAYLIIILSSSMMIRYDHITLSVFV